MSMDGAVSVQSRHLVNAQAVAARQRGAMLMKDGRGGLVDTPALIEALKGGQWG
ncbi:hypothetical protein B1218_37720 [Pseudomonas ogarae]|nr:hypothetical protein B1218_37720 [Pseudomonas ogarae]